MRRRPTVLAYHAVADCARGDDAHNLFVSPDAFAWQMRFLARRRRVVPLREAMIQATAGDRPAVSITFDDAYASLISGALPILARYAFPATIFVPTGWLGSDARWLGPSRCDARVMTAEELRVAAEAGVALESHGHLHPDMTSLTDEDVRVDVDASTAALAEIAGVRPRYFAYPYGASSASVRQIVRDAGYEAAFGIDRVGSDRFAYERTQVTPFDGPVVFAAKTSGWYLAVRHAPAVRTAYSVVKPAVRRVLSR